MRVKGARLRFVMLAAVFLIPIVAVGLALTFRATDPGPPLQVQPQTGSYQATVGRALSVTGFRIRNTSKSVVTIKRIRVAKGQPGVQVIGALAFRGCSSCVTSTAVPPQVSAPPDTATPKLLRRRALHAQARRAAHADPLRQGLAQAEHARAAAADRHDGARGESHDRDRARPRSLRRQELLSRAGGRTYSPRSLL